MAIRQPPQVFTARRSRFQKRQDACVVLRPSRAQGNHPQVARTHDTQRDSLHLGGLGLVQGILGERAELKAGMNWTGQSPTRIASPSGSRPREAQYA